MYAAIPDDVHESDEAGIVLRSHPKNAVLVKPLTPGHNLLGCGAKSTLVQVRQLPVIDRHRDLELDRHRYATSSGVILATLSRNVRRSTRSS